MIRELNNFLSNCRFKADSQAHQIVKNNSLDYYLERAVELINEARSYRDATRLIHAAKMLAYAYFRYYHEAVKATSGRGKRSRVQDSQSPNGSSKA